MALQITRNEAGTLTIGELDRGIRLDITKTEQGLHVEAYDWHGKPLDLLVLSAGMLDERRDKHPHPEVVFAYATMVTT